MQFPRSWSVRLQFPWCTVSAEPFQKNGRDGWYLRVFNFSERRYYLYNYTTALLEREADAPEQAPRHARQFTPPATR